jgi:hypothetical protein
MVRRVVEVRLDCDFLAGFVPDVAAAMSAIEVVKNGAPRLGIVFLIGETADGSGDHVVNDSLVIVGICPPGTGPIPGDSRWIVRPGDPARNDAAGNT